MKPSFKNKLIVSFFCIGVIPLILFNILYQQILGSRIITNTQNDTIQQLNYINGNLNRQTETAYRLLRWFIFNEGLEDILTKDYDTLTDQQLDITKFNKYATEYLINTSINDSVAKILILGENGVQFQIGDGMTVIDVKKALDAKWLENFQLPYINTLVLSKDLYYKGKYVFPLSSEITDSISGQRIGWCLILLKNDFFSKELEEFNKDENTEIFLINDFGQCIASKSADLIGKYIRIRPEIQNILHNTDNIGILNNRSKTDSILFYSRNPINHYITIQSSSLKNYYSEQKGVTYLMTLLIVFVVIFASLVIIFLCNKLSKPINYLANYVQGISTGDFSGSLKLKGDDEFSKIVNSINTMEHEIKSLIQKHIEEEKRKKELEFKVLQNQINPHFLYNTLNCIKWMAILQNSPSIRDMSSSLGRLLQNISHCNNGKIPIFEEMSLLDDYMFIQNIRYDGKIRLNYIIKDHALTQAYIIKFILQPIVENSIFHGIEPKGQEGTIDIVIEQNNQDIYISITDDGIGIAPEQVQSILDCKEETKSHRGMNGIGLKNVNDRLIMTYGDEYGITVESEQYKYTNITVKIPYEELST